MIKEFKPYKNEFLEQFEVIAILNKAKIMEKNIPEMGVPVEDTSYYNELMQNREFILKNEIKFEKFQNSTNKISRTIRLYKAQIEKRNFASKAYHSIADINNGNKKDIENKIAELEKMIGESPNLFNTLELLIKTHNNVSTMRKEISTAMSKRISVLLKEFSGKIGN